MINDDMILESDSAVAEMSELDYGNQARAGVYRLLAMLLASPPPQTVLSTIQTLRIIDEMHTATSMTSVWRQLILESERHSIAEIEAEYFDLFIGLGRGELVPYASWYLTGFLMEKPLAQLRSRLIELGLSRKQSVKEPEDHVAGLCEVMAMIIMDSRLSYLDGKLFFETYISSWMRRFFDDLKCAKASNYYQAVAGVGQVFLEVEQQWYDMLSVPD